MAHNEAYKKYQYNYKKTHYYTIPLQLKIEEDKDIIESLTGGRFEGNRNVWLKEIIREALAKRK